MAAKKTAAKKTAAKKTTAPAKKTAAPAKKAAAKKAPAKKAAAKQPALKSGDTLIVSVDRRQNNGSAEAVGQVIRVLDVAEERVNLQVLLDDSEGRRLMRNVPVLASRPKAGSDEASQPWAVRA